MSDRDKGGDGRLCSHIQVRGLLTFNRSLLTGALWRYAMKQLHVNRVII
jgi:hypothetical protein